MREATIKGRVKYLHLTDTVGCECLSLTLIPASGTALLISYVFIEQRFKYIYLPPPFEIGLLRPAAHLLTRIDWVYCIDK